MDIELAGTFLQNSFDGDFVAAGASPNGVAAWSRRCVDHRQRGYVIATVLARLGAMDAPIAS
ncbi:hypothetical protein JQ596_37815 [Bradyrhizobium manausense]|uniref:hypothetical protein n=1 Tax=Bradyrhizobium manausense TaxID=989370 RepID=UPI001BAA4AC3|nr:hypothetical protein [Bradyrhizobium manausense]MBR0831281.1 hypothetical protein [Bradyrhizobium manausense]